MVFSSITFIYYFLPIVLILYIIVTNKFKNLLLLISSLIFYFYGENIYIIVLIGSCLINYIGGILIEKYNGKKISKIFLILSIIINLGLLCYFKYTNFFINNLNTLFSSNIALLNIVMPIGISFFTFQTLSYCIDIYNNKIKANKNFIDFACYVSLFPQLIAGPIVRYNDICIELKNRKLNYNDFGNGVKRFIIGLAKKVLIANSIGSMIVLLTDIPNTTVLAHILIAIGFSLQIYFDFSGYSDMAIGLGKMLGFHFLENFNYPFIAKSITDFWRRWHISLSKFFRDYVYIPLGGNRVNLIKLIRNIFIVWFLTGFWHGANWNFIIWGLYFGIILIIEKYFLSNFLKNHTIIGHFYTIIIVLISFIIFSFDSISNITLFLKNMFGFSNLPFTNFETWYYLRSYIVIIILAIIGSTPIIKNIYDKLSNKFKNIMGIFEIIGCFLLLIVVTSFLIDSSFNPFLYFRF